MPLLEPRVLESLERFAAATRTRLLGFFSGDHRSKRHGSSVDFADYREYRPGDDFRRIDLALSARFDRLFLRLFEAEEDVPVRIVVDSSASMAFGDPSKHLLATQAAAAFAHIALVQGDRVRIYAASDGGARPSRWFRSRSDSIPAMQWLEQLAPAGPSGVRASVRAIAEESRPGVTIAVADMLDHDWEDTIRLLSGRGEAALLHLLSREEVEPSIEGDLTLTDVETGDEVLVSATPETLTGYTMRLREWMGSVRSACTSRNVAYATCLSDISVEELFVKTLVKERIIT